jgi:hypothetical protein
MKDIKITHLHLFIIVYLLFSFAEMTVNANKWGLETRWFFVVIFGIISAIKLANEE